MCKKCETNPVYEFTNKRKVCSSCFIRYFQKKFLYTLRKFNMIDNEDLIYFRSNKNFRDAVLNDLLILFEEKSSIKLTNNQNKSDKTAVSSTIDSEANQVIDILINDKSDNLKKLSPVTKDNKETIIKPLYLFSDREILLYAKLKGLKFKKEKQKQDNISEFLNNMEDKHPEVKRAVVNSYLKLNKTE